MANEILAKKYKYSPFTDDILDIPTGRKSERITTKGPISVVDDHTGEVISVAEIRNTKWVDKEQFVKLFVGHLHVLLDLKPGTMRIMTAIIDELSNTQYINGDVIYLNFNKVREFFERKGVKSPSKPTFFSAMAEMTEKRIIAPSVDQNLWFINPQLIFNGDRVQLTTELRIQKKSRMQKLEAEGQQNWIDDQRGNEGGE